MFEHSHNGKLLDTDLNNIREKLLSEQDASKISIKKTKIIDLNYVMENHGEQEKEPHLFRSNSTSIHKHDSQYKDVKLSSARKEVQL